MKGIQQGTVSQLENENFYSQSKYILKENATQLGVSALIKATPGVWVADDRGISVGRGNATVESYRSPTV